MHRGEGHGHGHGGGWEGLVIPVLQSGWTPLMEAAFKGHESVVNRLVRAHADIDLKDKVLQHSALWVPAYGAL